jgi:hypothetical protein
MTGIVYRRLMMFLLLIPLTHITSYAQDVTGIWRGYFISDDGTQYKLEFQISQNPTNTVAGISYSYLDVRFYGKATMTGTFIKTSSSFRIREIRTVEVKSSLGGATCIMNYNFNYEKSGKEEFLEGTYLGKFESKYKTNPPAAWGDCGGGKVFLRKVTSSDFYVEPFLRNKVKSNTPVIYNKPPGRKITPAPEIKAPLVTNKPVQKTTTSPIIKKPDPLVKKPVTINKPLVKTNTPTTKITAPIPQKTDTIQKKIPLVIKNNAPVQPVSTPEVLKTRSNELVKVLVVNDPDVTVKLYDNGVIDGDTISVYLDKKLVLSSKGLSATPLIVKLKMDEDNSEHELVMVAENLGRIPPNTSLMTVESGDQRFDVRITSTEQKNALVRFKYQKPK